MATRKKAKPKTKSKKTSVKKRPAGKKAVKKKAAVRRPAPKKKPLAKKPAARAAAIKKPAPVPAAAPLPGEERVGTVIHYYSHLSVAIVRLESGSLREGDTIHVKGHTSDFRQRVQSMEIDHVHVPEARPGQEFGLKVIEHAREHDAVYKVGA
jgi:putative protease